MTEWYNETLFADFAQRFAVTRVLFEEKTEHQHMIIFENPRFGRVLALDGTIQTTEADEFVYHEMLTHVPLFAHGQARRVLIIGGGDGGIAREVLTHPEVEKVTMVEIDRTVVDLCAKYMPSISGGAFTHPKFELLIEDGCKFIKETQDKYDVIIVDSSDPSGPSAVLYTEEFYQDCKAHMTPGGILVRMSEVPFMQKNELQMIKRRLSAVFKDTGFYVAAVPTYVGGLMTLGWGSDNPAHRQVAAEEIARRFQQSGIKTRYYSPALHSACFALPQFIQDILAEADEKAKAA